MRKPGIPPARIPEITWHRPSRHNDSHEGTSKQTPATPGIEPQCDIGHTREKKRAQRSNFKRREQSFIHHRAKNCSFAAERDPASPIGGYVGKRRRLTGLLLRPNVMNCGLMQQGRRG